MIDPSRMLSCYAAALLVTCSVYAQAPTPQSNITQIQTLIPIEHTLFVHATMEQTAKDPTFAKMTTTVATELTRIVKGYEAMPLVQLLNLSLKTLSDVYLTADLRPTRQGLGDAIGIFTFNATINLEEAVKIAQKATDRKALAKLQTEMINGYIVLVHEPSDWAVMQLSPKTILISARATIKRVTKLRRADSMARHGALMAMIRANTDSNAVAGAVKAVPGTDLPFDSMRLVYPAKSANSTGVVHAMIRGKSRRGATMLASAITTRFGPLLPDLTVTQTGADILVKVTPTIKGIEHLFQAMRSSGLFEQPDTTNRLSTPSSPESPTTRGPDEN